MDRELTRQQQIKLLSMGFSDSADAINRELLLELSKANKKVNRLLAEVKELRERLTLLAGRRKDSG